MSTQPPAADWYPDPSGNPGLMYWDGQQWHTDVPATPPPADQLPPQPNSTTPLPPRHRSVIAAVVVVTVVVGILGIAGYLLLQHKHASQIPTAQSTSPSGQTAQLAPPSRQTAQLAPPSRQTAQLAPPSAVAPSTTAPPAYELPGLAPFLGHWGGGHSGGLDIHSDGTGRWRYSDISTCPDAPLAGCGITGTADFRLTSVANGTATGSVTGGSNPKNDPVGEPVTIVLGSGLNGKGVVLAVSISKMKGWNFCNDSSPHYCAES
jgi:hypothetical protein